MCVHVYVHLYFLLPKHCSADCVWMREAEARPRHEDLVLCNFLKQNCLFEIPKTLLGEGLHSSAQIIPEGCCIYSSRRSRSRCRRELDRNLLLSFHFAPSCTAKIICSRESATGICSFCVPAPHCHGSCLLRWAFLLTHTGLCFPLVPMQLSGNSSLHWGLSSPTLGPAEGWMDSVSSCFQPCLLLGLIRLS